MTEHLSEMALGQQVLAWCRVCRRDTMHTVCRVLVGGKACKPDVCLEHNAPELTLAQKKRRAQTARLRRDPLLFEEPL